jgi:predicted metal-dependent phosphoesterase TrpH
MDLRADLHLHTTASDGCWTPEQLVEEVRQTGIGLFAVTDHDSLGSLRVTADLIRGSGLSFLPGAELSACMGGQLYHLLAYGIDPHDPTLNSLVLASNLRLQAASDDAIAMLVKAGFDITLDDYVAYDWDRRRGGWKALNFLIDRGFCRDVRSYFDELFVGRLAHPQADFPPPELLIAAAQNAGGLVVLAHPGARSYNGLGRERLDDLVDMGLSGLECYSMHHDAMTTLRFLEYCRGRDLLITGGSDCHGGLVQRSLGHPLVYAHELRLGPLQERLMA